VLTNPNFQSRELVNERAAVVTPSYLEKLAVKMGETFPDRLRVRVINAKELTENGLHLITAVGQAAEEPPRLVLIEMMGQDSESGKCLNPGTKFVLVKLVSQANKDRI
jgi:leucyl aminopeptidase